MLPDRSALLLLITLTSGTGCSESTTAPGRADAAIAPDASAATDASTDAPDGSIGHPDAAVATGPARSDKARVRWKGQSLLASQLASALDLPRDQVWRELGRFDGFDIHRIALGGVEPYTLGINEPFPDTAVTAPLAIERIALGGCKARVDADLATPDSAVVFGGVGADAIDVASAAPRESIERLYARFLARRPTADETQVLLDLYGDVTAASEPRPGRAWAILSCFAVATSLEALFY